MAADRALFAAFQKVRADVDAALAETRRKEAELRAKEEAEALAARREKKRLSILGTIRPRVFERWVTRLRAIWLGT